jgi:hypothetical protein
MPTYTRGELKERINAGIKGKRGMLSNFDGTVNDAVRSVAIDTLDLRSLRRKATIAPGLFSEVNTYPLPVDLKGNRIVSISPQKQDAGHYRYSLVPFEDFMEMRKQGTIAVNDHDNVRKLLIQAPTTGNTLRVSPLDSLTSGGGTWGLFGTTTAVTADGNFLVYGTGSVAYNIGAAVGTTSGIVNSTMTVFDFSEHTTTSSSAFVYAYIKDTTGVSSFTLRIGQDASHYYHITVTQTHFGTSLAAGWNLLRFDFVNAQKVGTVDATDGRYVALILNKLTTKVTEEGYRFDNLVLGTGAPQNIFYYSQYPWTDSVTGARARIAVRDGDVLLAEEDEYNLFVYKGIELAAVEVDEISTAQYAAEAFKNLSKDYGTNYPSEAMLMTSDYQAQYYI